MAVFIVVWLVARGSSRPQFSATAAAGATRCGPRPGERPGFHRVRRTNRPRRRGRPAARHAAVDGGAERGLPPRRKNREVAWRGDTGGVYLSKRYFLDVKEALVDEFVDGRAGLARGPKAGGAWVPPNGRSAPLRLPGC